MSAKPILFTLTCANEVEAGRITNKLLDEKLVVCAKRLPVRSSFLFKGRVDNSDEILLIFESVESNFGKIEEEVKKIHSYDTFVLTAIPIVKTTQKVKDWIKKEIRYK